MPKGKPKLSGGKKLANRFKMEQKLTRYMPTTLTTSLLKKEAAVFAKAESKHAEPTLFGVTDGKAVGTYLEHKFQNKL